MYSTFFAEGAHSLDSTGEQSEADFPLYVQLFEDFFTWKASSLPGHVREWGIHLRDQRCHHSHLIVGAQVSSLCLFHFFYPFNLTLYYIIINFYFNFPSCSFRGSSSGAKD